MDNQNKANNKSFKGFLSKEIGDLGQKAVETCLIPRGFELVGKNIRIGNYGEIDLILKSKDGKFLFIEVKASFTSKGLDIEAGDRAGIGVSDNQPQSTLIMPTFAIHERIPYKKKLKIYGCAERYCMKNGINFDESADLYIAHILLFSKELQNSTKSVSPADILKRLYYKPHFFKLV